MSEQQQGTPGEVGQVFFFGPWQRAGHYYWSPRMRRVRFHEEPGPWGLKIDGELTPKSTQAQGAAALHHLDGWTALAFHDYTSDRRPGSNGAFIVDAVLDFDEMLALANAHFPAVVEQVGPICPTPDGAA